MQSRPDKTEVLGSSPGFPLLIAGLGEQISEKAGVLNIGLEGMMLFGAFAGFSVTYYSGSFTFGFVVGGLAGMACALVMVVLCIILGMNQIVIGIAITLGAEGLTALLHHFLFSRSYPRLPKSETLAIPGLSELPVVGHAISKLSAIVVKVLLKSWMIN